MKKINHYLRESFLMYLEDGNVIEIEDDIFANQISIYQDRQKGYFNLYRYFIKQIMCD